MIIVVFLILSVVILLASILRRAETYVDVPKCKDSLGKKTRGGDGRLYKTENNRVCVVADATQVVPPKVVPPKVVPQVLPQVAPKVAAPTSTINRCKNSLGPKKLAGDRQLWGFENEQPCLY